MPPVMSLADQQDLRKRLAAGGDSQAPRMRQMTERMLRPGLFGDTIGRPYSARNIPLSQIYEMRLDAVLAFAALFSKMPMYTAQRRIVCRSPKKAAFLDEALRQIWGRLVQQRTMAWDFGYQAVVKQFDLVVPGWTYLDKEDLDAGPKRVWDEGDIPALIWKPFVPLRPETVEPRWDQNTGRFDGIKIDGVGAYSFPSLPIKEGDVEVGRLVDVDHALWFVNQKDDEFGSLWGRSRMAYAYKYWWASEMVLSILNRSVERKGDPSIVVRHPPGKSRQGGEMVDNALHALKLGSLARSGAVLALPSDPITDMDEKVTREMYQWSIEYLETEEKFEELQAIMGYFDVQKFRASMVADQALAEGKGGTSSRNVAASMAESTTRMSVVSLDELIAEVNAYLIPQLEEANFPELADDPARVEVIDTGSQGYDMAKALFQAWAQRPEADGVISWRDLAGQFDIPTTSGEVKSAEEAAIAQAANTKPPAVDPVAGGAAGITDTGFYVAARDLIVLSDETFLSSLPATKHFQDRAVLATAREIRTAMARRYADQIEDFAKHVERGGGIHLAQEDDASQSVVDRVMASWNYATEVSAKAVGAVSSALGRVFSRAGRLELKRVGLSEKTWRPDEQDLAKWVADHAAEMVTSVDLTTRAELSRFLLDQVKADTKPALIAQQIREHFSDFPSWKADRLTRTEVRRFYNSATLFAARDAGAATVQALDARLGPSDHPCEDRNGRFFSIEDAFREEAKEHPNGTLAWRIIAGAPLALERVDGDSSPDFAARWDRESDTVFLRDDLTDAEVGHYLDSIGRRMELEAVLPVG